MLLKTLKATIDLCPTNCPSLSADAIATAAAAAAIQPIVVVGAAAVVDL